MLSYISYISNEFCCNSSTNIPQLDGLHNDDVIASSALECEKCGLTFTSNELYYEHTHYGHEIVIGHDYFCDDCLICFDTKLDSDIHELEVHPDEHYAQNDIPDSTRLIFLQRKS